MSIDKKDKEAPDLENIAKRYALIEEDNELSQIIARAMDSWTSMKFSDGSTVKYEKDGITRYKEDLSDNQKEELATALSRSLVYHAYIIQNGMKPKDLDTFFSAKTKSGRYISDGVLEAEFGINRYAIKKWILGMSKVTGDNIYRQFEHFVGVQKEKIEKTLKTEAENAGPDKIKAFIKKAYEKHGSEGKKDEVYAALDKAYTVDELLPLYGLAAQFYKPGKEKKK